MNALASDRQAGHARSFEIAQLGHGCWHQTLWQKENGTGIGSFSDPHFNRFADHRDDPSDRVLRRAQAASAPRNFKPFQIDEDMMHSSKTGCFACSCRYCPGICGRAGMGVEIAAQFPHQAADGATSASPMTVHQLLSTPSTIRGMTHTLPRGGRSAGSRISSITRRLRFSGLSRIR